MAPKKLPDPGPGSGSCVIGVLLLLIMVASLVYASINSAYTWDETARKLITNTPPPATQTPLPDYWWVVAKVVEDPQVNGSSGFNVWIVVEVISSEAVAIPGERYNMILPTSYKAKLTKGDAVRMICSGIDTTRQRLMCDSEQIVIEH